MFQFPASPSVGQLYTPSAGITFRWSGTAWHLLGGGGGHVIEDEGTPIPAQASLNFTGAGVTVTDAGGKTVVTIPGSSTTVDGHVIEDEGTPLAQRSNINFTGAGVAVTDSGGKTVVTVAGSTGGAVAGADKQIQFNDGGAFGGDADLTWDKTTNTMLVGTTATPFVIKGNTGVAINDDGASITLLGGNGAPTGFGSYGGNVYLKGGTCGPEAVTAGHVYLQGGFSTTTNTPGNVYIDGGLGVNGTGYGGHIYINGGGTQSPGATSPGYAGHVYIKGGNSSGAISGSIDIQGGTGTNSSAGNVTVAAGAAGGSFSSAGVLSLSAGNAVGFAAGGAVTLTAGNAHASASAHVGGSVTISAGNGGGTASGGNILIRPGGAGGSGPFGNIQLDGGRGAALATNSTGGFITIPTCAGTPTGVPTAANVPTGSVAMVFDTTNNILYFYDGGWVTAGGGGGSAPPIPVACSDETTDLTTGTAKVTFRMPYAMTLTKIKGSLSTAASSGIVTVDVNKNGASLFSTLLTFDATEKTTATAAIAAVLGTTALADDDEITVDIDVAGTGAKGLKIYLI